MCAINGFNFKDQGLIGKMNAENRHRGPDGSGVFLDEKISLGHNRLSIIDLSDAASQPMKSADGKLVIVFNGEIYNYRELKEELKGSYPFRTSSDTEVILAAYAKWGRECVKKFNGIFAFAIWDAAKAELFLARDHAGVKPLYYFYDGKRFIFSSEIKSILAHDVPRVVSKEAFNFYFHLYYVPEPLTMFEGIKKLPAASYAILKDGKLQIGKYWAVTDFSDLRSRDEARQEIRSLFDDSVKRQLISDRPVGVFLSGGMDSTAVLGSVLRAAGKAKTFSVGFDVAEQSDKFNADFLLARRTAAHYGAEHYELMIGANDIGDNLEKIAWHLDEPNFNPTAGAIYLLSKMAKEKVAVVLGGDGGDELFGGYPRYFASGLISAFQRLPFSSVLAALFGKERAEKLRLPADASRIVAFLSEKEGNSRGVLAQGLSDPAAIPRHFAERYFTPTPNEHVLRASNDARLVWGLGDASPRDFEKRFMNIDRQSWLVDESLMRSDKMSMAAGLEERVPMLDYRLAELAMRIPTSWKFSLIGNTAGNFQGKRIWREAIADYLPPHVLLERKRGWFTPMAKWMRGELKDKVGAILESAPAEYFDKAGLRAAWEDHLSGKRYNLNMLWAIVMWTLWHKRFME